jgi:hypothetical protein
MKMVCCVLMVLAITSAHGADSDVLIRAVGFALTGNDDDVPKVIDRKNCVFGIGKDVFRLNNVHTDRLLIQGWKQTTVRGERRWVTVELHGDSTVYEHTTEPVQDDGSSYLDYFRQHDPSMFKPQHETHKEYQLTLYTADQDRVTRAWQYIYSHGCVGRQSPF